MGKKKKRNPLLEVPVMQHVESDKPPAAVSVSGGYGNQFGNRLYGTDSEISGE